MILSQYFTFDKIICNSREYMSGLSARLNSWLWSQNKRKVDAGVSAATSIRADADSEFCVKFPDVYSLIYNVFANPDQSSSWYWEEEGGGELWSTLEVFCWMDWWTNNQSSLVESNTSLPTIPQTICHTFFSYHQHRQDYNSIRGGGRGGTGGKGNTRIWAIA